MKDNHTDDENKVSLSATDNTADTERSAAFADKTESADGSGAAAIGDMPVPRKPQNPKRTGMMIIALGLFVIIVIAIGIVIAVFMSKAEKHANGDTSPFAETTRFASPKELTAAVEPDLRGAVVAVQAATGVSAVDGDGIYAYGAPAYKEGDMKFNVLPLAITGSAYKSDLATAKANYAALEKFFETNKFKKKFSSTNAPGAASDVEQAVNYVAYAEYESSNILCSIRHADATTTKAASHIASIGCADKESYGQAAKVLQPFYAAYVGAGSDVSKNLVFGFLRETSGSDGYKHTEIYQEDDNQYAEGQDVKPFTGLYYQRSGDKAWTYFSITPVDTTLYCEAYTTPALKSAFKGYECFDNPSQQDSVVK